MPHVNEKIAAMSGNRHVHAFKGSPIEHNPHGYTTPVDHFLKSTDEAVKKERRLGGETR